MKKTHPLPPKRPARGRGRPPKNGIGRKETNVGLPPALLAELDRYVAVLREKAPGIGRGVVIAKALRAYRPFSRWINKS